MFFYHKFIVDPAIEKIFYPDCYTPDSLAPSSVNARLDEYCGNYVRGSNVIQLKREIEVFRHKILCLNLYRY